MATDLLSHTDARNHLEQGLVAIRKQLPSVSANQQIELDLLVSSGPSVVATAGYTSRAPTSVLNEGLLLSEAVGDPVQPFRAMRDLWAHHIVASELDAARDTALEMCQIAEDQANAGLLLEAHRALGQAFMFRGELVAAMAKIDRVIGMYNPAGHIEYSARYGSESLAIAFSYKGWVSALMGLPDAALDWSRKAIARARGGPPALPLHKFLLTLCTPAHSVGRFRKFAQSPSVQCSMQSIKDFYFGNI